MSMIFFIACNSDKRDITPTTIPTSPTVNKVTAYFIDAGVEGISYTSNKEDSGITDVDGRFRYTEGAQVTFKIGGVEVGSITNINSDKKVLIQDLLGVNREDTNNSQVLKIARFLQSLDSNQDPSDGIDISSQLTQQLATQNIRLEDSTLEYLDNLVTKTLDLTLVSAEDARRHLNSVLAEINIEPIDPTATGNIAAKYYGKWVYIHNGNVLNILSDTNLNGFGAIDDNLIKITEDGVQYSLMRSSVANTQIKGKIDTISTTSESPARRASDIANINVILENLLDSNIKTEVTTDALGNFTDHTLPSGTYSIGATDGNNELHTTVTLVDEDEDLGTFKLTGKDLYNFKAELLLDQEFVYGDDNTYTGKIRIHNISDSVTGYGLSYEINVTDDYIKDFNADIASALGSVPPKTYKDIAITFKTNGMHKNEKGVNVLVKIKDANSNLWLDNFKFSIYKAPVDINIATKTANIKGYLIMPNTNEIKQINMSSGTITVPTLSDTYYSIVFSNPSLTEETVYSMGVDIVADNDFTVFTNTSADEPNNKESEAKILITGEETMSYLHLTDVDYWKISTPENLFLTSGFMQEGNFAQRASTEINTSIISNEINISSLPKDVNETISVDNGTIILNGIDTLSKSANVKNGDQVAINLSIKKATDTFESAKLRIGEVTKEYILTNNYIYVNKEKTLAWVDYENNNSDLYPTNKWQDAINYCSTLDVYGFTNWRLPTIHELKSLYLARSYLRSGSRNAYLAIDDYESDTSKSWAIAMENGRIFGYHKDNFGLSTRCVRNIEE